MFANITADWWRHLAGQLVSVLVLAFLHFISGYDWSALGVWGPAIPAFAGLAIEAFNQALGVTPPAIQTKLLEQARLLGNGVGRGLGALMIYGLVLGSAFSLAACDPTSLNISALESDVISAVQADVLEACSVVPEFADIAAMLTGSSTLSDASTIASAICQGVAQSTAPATSLKRVRDRRVKGGFRLAPPPITVNGHVVHFL